METIGIICEYNPFHRGHKEQIDYLRTHFPHAVLICVMSGAFVQRGECAIAPKYLRAEAAVREGADVVIELPYPWCASSAQTFAQGGVDLLSALAVEGICFGAECADEGLLQRTAQRLASAEFSAAMTVDVGKENESYIRHCQRIYEVCYGEGFPVLPNDILAVSYLRAIAQRGSALTPIILHRTSPYSATESRSALREGNGAAIMRLIPEQAREVFLRTSPIPALLPAQTVLPFFALQPDAERLCAFDGMSPGIPTRMKRVAAAVCDTEQLIASMTSRRDTAAKIRRSILAAITETTREMTEARPRYTHLLAASGRGRKQLSVWRKQSDFPILTRPSGGFRLTGEASAQFIHAHRAEILAAVACGMPIDELMRQRPYTEEPH